MLSACLLLLALQEPSASPAASPSPSGTDHKASPSVRDETRERTAPSKGSRKTARGTFGGIDLEQRTVRFIDEHGRSQVWGVDEKLAAASPARAEMLTKAFQPGEPIYVVYHEDAGKPTITEIVKRTATDDELDRREKEKQ